MRMKSSGVIQTHRVLAAYAPGATRSNKARNPDKSLIVCMGNFR